MKSYQIETNTLEDGSTVECFELLANFQSLANNATSILRKDLLSMTIAKGLILSLYLKYGVLTFELSINREGVKQRVESRKFYVQGNSMHFAISGMKESDVVTIELSNGVIDRLLTEVIATLERYSK